MNADNDKRPTCARCKCELVIAEDLPHDVCLAAVSDNASEVTLEEWRDADVSLCIICMEKIHDEPKVQRARNDKVECLEDYRRDENQWLYVAMRLERWRTQRLAEEERRLVEWNEDMKMIQRRVTA